MRRGMDEGISRCWCTVLSCRTSWRRRNDRRNDCSCRLRQVGSVHSASPGASHGSCGTHRTHADGWSPCSRQGGRRRPQHHARLTLTSSHFSRASSSSSASGALGKNMTLLKHRDDTGMPADGARKRRRSLAS